MFNIKRQVTFQGTVPERPFLIRLSIDGNDDRNETDHDGAVAVKVANKWMTRRQLIELRRQIDNALEEGVTA